MSSNLMVEEIRAIEKRITELEEAKNNGSNNNFLLAIEELKKELVKVKEELEFIKAKEEAAYNQNLSSSLASEMRAENLSDNKKKKEEEKEKKALEETVIELIKDDGSYFFRQPQALSENDLSQDIDFDDAKKNLEEPPEPQEPEQQLVLVKNSDQKDFNQGDSNEVDSSQKSSDQKDVAKLTYAELKDFLEIKEEDSEVNEGIIKKAYSKKLRSLHPDKNEQNEKDQAEATKNFQEQFGRLKLVRTEILKRTQEREKASGASKADEVKENDSATEDQESAPLMILDDPEKKPQDDQPPSVTQKSFANRYPSKKEGFEGLVLKRVREIEEKLSFAQRIIDERSGGNREGSKNVR